MAHSERIRYLLRRYFHNQCTSYEWDELMQWMQKPENQQDLEIYLHQHWQELKDDLPPTVISYDQVWQNLQQNIIDKPVAATQKAWFKIAAAVFLAAVVAALLYTQLYIEEPSAEIAMQTFLNPKGERSMVNLPDGSVVWLNAASKIEYPSQFSDQYRKVRLSGEAYFDVVKDATPFIIVTESAEIEVLGTSFNVSAYPDDDSFSTTLVEGEVLLKFGGNIFKKATETKLQPLQRASYLKSNKKLALEKVSDVSLYTSWKDGKLVFANTRFSVAVTKLERWFDKDIELLDDIDKERFTGTFEHESLEQILEIVNTSTPIEYSITGDKVLIKLKK